MIASSFFKPRALCFLGNIVTTDDIAGVEWGNEDHRLVILHSKTIVPEKLCLASIFKAQGLILNQNDTLVKNL